MQTYQLLEFYKTKPTTAFCHFHQAAWSYIDLLSVTVPFLIYTALLMIFMKKKKRGVLSFCHRRYCIPLTKLYQWVILFSGLSMIIPVYITLKGELNLLRPVLASTSHTYLFISMHQMVITSTQWHRTQVSSLSPTLYCLLLPRLSCYCAL